MNGRRAFALYAALTVVMAYPFSLHPAAGVLTIGTDTDLYIWALGWDVHAFLHHPFSIFDANIFYPFKHTLAYSENVIGSAMLAAPVIWVTHNPMLAFNLVALASIPLSAYGAYLLGRRLGLSAPASILCGLIFGFSPPRFLRLDQFHLTTIQWVPFALAYLHGYFQTGARRDLRLAAAFFSLQALTSGHGAAMLVLGMLLLVSERLLRGEPLAPVKRLRDLGVVGALALLPSALIYRPYRAAQVEIGLRRALDDWSVATSSFFASGSHFQTWLISRMPDWDWLKHEPDALLFPGLLPIALAAAAFFVRSRSRPATPAPDYRWLYLAVVLVTLWFAVAPPYGVWRWVYWLPGLNFVRVPSRFMLLGLLGLGVLAAFGFDRLMAARPAAARTRAAAVIGLLMLGEFAVLPLDVQPYRVDPPGVDRWLATQPAPFAVVEMPVPDSYSVITQERRTTLYMLHSLGHYQPIVQGYSGIQPPGYEALHQKLITFPDEASLRALIDLGVKYAVEHIDLIPPSERDEVAARYDKFKDWLTLEHMDGQGRVYLLHYPRQ
ncbi:MAG TPA: hypothetical protein VJN96_26050 [Vicinamibacterales bacterium]|nr:hypothetical protein [Vicinamibacterales bacterium]